MSSNNIADKIITTLRIAKLIVLLILFLLLLPILAIWLLVKVIVYKIVMRHNMIKCGMPKRAATSLALHGKIPIQPPIV